MNDVTLVEVIEAFQDLSDEVLHERLFEGPVITQECCYGSSRNVFQENVQKVVFQRRICTGKT